MKLEVVKENKLNERYTIPVDSKLHHKHDGTIKENDTIYTVTIFNNKGENGHDIIMSNADDAFDEVFFNTPEEAKSFADKNYPDAWNVVIREEDWYDETLGDTRTSGPFLERENGKWFDPQADWKKENDVRLNEGAGAGYTVQGELYEIKINHIEDIDIRQGKSAFGTDLEFATVKVDADAKFDGTVESYYYGAELESAQVKITELDINPNIFYYLELEEFNYGEITAEDLQSQFGSTLKFESDVIGGGWAHTPFDGNVTASRVVDDYSPFVDGVSFHFVNQADIDYAEQGLQGELDDDYSEDNYDLEEEFDPMKDARSNILEFPNGGDSIVLNVEYKDGKLIAGSATNAGIIPEFEIEYDKDFDLDWNLNVLYNVIVEEHPEYLEMKRMKESIKTRKSVRVREAQNVEDQVIVDIRKPGYLSKMDELRKQGYKRLWSGDGKICFAKPKELKENRTLTEEVSSEAYEVANKMKIAFDKMDKVTWDDFDEQFALAIRDTFGIDNIWEQEDEFKLDTDTGKIDINDFENDIRGILGMNGYETELEGENEGGLKRITENKSLKEDYSDSDIRRAIFRVHDIMEDTYTQVVADITSRALDNNPEEDVYEAVNNAIDEGLIYYNDEWAVIEHYTTPKDIDSDTYINAIQQLSEDVIEVVNYLLENGDSLTESTTTDILKNQSQNIEKPTTTGEAQSPAYADAARELDKAKEIKDKKVGADLDNVLNKKFDLGKAKKLTLDESLFN